MKWRRNPGILWRRAPGYLALATIDGHVVEIGGPGGEVWERLSAWIGEEVLVGDLARQFGADGQMVSADVQSLLEQLYAQGFVERDG